MKSWHLILVFLLLGAAWPRYVTTDSVPNSPNMTAARDTAARIDHDIDSFDDGSLGDDLWRALVVQGYRYHDVRHMAGSCAGDPNKPKPDPAYDIVITKTELGPFGIPMHSRNIVCGGRIPLRGSIYTAG